MSDAFWAIDWTLSILDENDCILQITNTLGKGMNPIILPPVVGLTDFFSLAEATRLVGGKLWITPVKLCLKLTLCYILPEHRGWYLWMGHLKVQPL